MTGKFWCATKPLLRQGFADRRGIFGTGRIAASVFKEASRTGPGFPVELEHRAGPERFKGLTRGSRPPPHSRSVPGYGRDPVGNGHAAAGFSAVLAPGVAAVDGGVALTVVIDAAVLAIGLADFFFFLAVFFFLPAAFFLAVFLDAFFFAITISLEVVAKESPAAPARTIQAPDGNRPAD